VAISAALVRLRALAAGTRSVVIASPLFAVTTQTPERAALLSLAVEPNRHNVGHTGT